MRAISYLFLILAFGLALALVLTPTALTNYEGNFSAFKAEHPQQAHTYLSAGRHGIMVAGQYHIAASQRLLRMANWYLDFLATQHRLLTPRLTLTHDRTDLNTESNPNTEPHRPEC